MRVSEIRPDWLEGVVVDLSEQDVMADLDPGLLRWGTDLQPALSRSRDAR